MGVERLSGGEYTIGPDHIEVASFIGLAAATGGELMVEGGDRCRTMVEGGDRCRT